MLEVLLILGLLFWGAFWGLVRDQDGPFPIQKPASADGNKWKEVGGIAWTLPFAALELRYTVDPLWLDLLGGALTLGIGAVAFYAQHAILDSFRSKGDQRGNATGLTYSPNRFGHFEPRECYVNLALGGALVGLGPAAYLALAGHYVMPLALVLLCAAYKPLCYKAAWAIVGNSEHGPSEPKYAHATFWGHVSHFALSVATAGACLYLGA